MFNEIVDIAHERVVTADDFRPFVGQSNWLAFDKGEPLGNAADVPSEPWLSGVIYEFCLAHILDNGLIRINIEIGKTQVRSMLIDADELVIRMDAS